MECYAIPSSLKVYLEVHAHIDSMRRDPYLAGEPYGNHHTGTTIEVSAPAGLVYCFPRSLCRTLNHCSPAILCSPNQMKRVSLLMTNSMCAESVDIYIADEGTYYDYFDCTVYSGAGRSHTVPALLEKFPLLMQGGHAIPRKERPRNSSGLMR